MTPTQLKQNYEINNPNGRFFSRENMKFSGDTMSNFGCYDNGEYYILYRKSRTIKGATGSFKFEKETFKYKGIC